MKNYFIIILLIFSSCVKKDALQESSLLSELYNPTPLVLTPPKGFPAFAISESEMPTVAEVRLGEKLFHDPTLSNDGTIACSSCHMKRFAYADNHYQAIGVKNRVGLRNALPIQNMIFLHTYMWDGAVTTLENQPVIPIVTHQEMDSSVLDILSKLKENPTYVRLFKEAFPDGKINRTHLFKSLASYMYSLISSQSKYDAVMQGTDFFTTEETKGYELFKHWCQSCHSGALFTDEQFHNIGFPPNPDTEEEHGRARVTGKKSDYLKFRTPSLRNVAFTAPYGSFGQFDTLEDVLAFLNEGVHQAGNLAPELKKHEGRIPLSPEEQQALVVFMKTLSDFSFVN